MLGVPHPGAAPLAQATQGARDLRQLAVLVEQAARLAQDQLPVHVHGQRTEVEQHLVRAQILGHHIVRIDGYDGQAEEQMKVVRQVVRPAGLPHPDDHRLGKLALEAEEQPTVAEEQLHGVVVLLQVLVEPRQHHPDQFPQVAQVVVHVPVGGSAYEERPLHQTHEAPEGLRLVLHFAQNRCQEITHTLKYTKMLKEVG